MNTEDALTEDVLAVTVSFPVAAAGMVIKVLNAPLDVDRKEDTADPATTVPDVETLNPVPVTVTDEPAAPVAGLREICAAGAAWAG